MQVGCCAHVFRCGPYLLPRELQVIYIILNIIHIYIYIQWWTKYSAEGAAPPPPPRKSCRSSREKLWKIYNTRKKSASWQLVGQNCPAKNDVKLPIPFRNQWKISPKRHVSLKSYIKLYHQINKPPWNMSSNKPSNHRKKCSEDWFMILL